MFRSAFPLNYRAGREITYVVSPIDWTVLGLEPSVAALLRLCRGCRTIEAHREALLQTNAGRDAVDGALRFFLERGLLRSCEDLTLAREVPDADGGRIETVAVMTYERPQVLQRCLQSVIDNVEAHGHRPRLLIVDGSRGIEHCRQNRHLANAFALDRGFRVDYVGDVETGVYCRRLASAGVPTDVLRFGLTPGAIGANRNIALLLTAGEHILMVDDDIVCRPWTGSIRQPGLGVVGGRDPRVTRVFPCRQSALASLSWIDADVLGAHAALVGKPLRTLLSIEGARADFSEAAPHVMTSISERRTQTVLATFCGIAGDSGTYCPYLRLFSAGTIQHEMRRTKDAFDLALRSREIVRIAPRTSVTSYYGCMAYCMGLANTSALAPFVPRGRNEDGLFGVIVGRVAPSALFAHLPIGVVHDSARSAAYDQARIESASGIRLADLLALLVQHPPIVGDDSECRLRRLADYLIDLGHCSLADFTSVIIGAALSARADDCARIDQIISKPDSYPPYWIAELRKYRDALTAGLAQTDFFVPVEFERTNSTSTKDAFRCVQRFTGAFGKLMLVWSRIWSEARRINADYATNRQREIASGEHCGC